MSRWFRSIVLVALLSAPGLARAQSGSAASMATLSAERQKVRAGLDRVNAEIDALKHEKRGLREDYQLRARMADAEAMAQRLIDLDVRIERLTPQGGRRATTPMVLAAPEARPLDDRAALEAKADILSDQAHRLESQAGLLAVRGRQELRRRAGQLERDPFSPLEQSKRRIAAGAPMGTTGAKDLGGVATPGGTTAGGVTPPPSRGNEGITGAGTGSTTPTGGPNAPATPGGGITTDSARIATSGSLAQTAVPVGAPDAPGSVAGQFRGVLDAATLAEIRRLEGVGSPGSNLQAMERALSALRQRAALLKASAADLRARAKTAP
jgi:hypothetical protein